MIKQITSVLFFVMAALANANAQFGISANAGFGGMLHNTLYGKIKMKPTAGINLEFLQKFDKHWGLITGIGGSYHATDAYVQNGNTLTANQADDMGAAFEYRIKSMNYRETQKLFAINIPVMMQYRSARSVYTQWYLNFGVKAIIPVQSDIEASAQQLDLAGYYPDVHLEVQNLPQHGFGTIYNWTGNTSYAMNPAVAGTIGSGVSFKLKNEARFYIGIYGDYALNDMRKKETRLPLVTYNAPLNNGVQANSLLSVANSKGAHLFSSGIQLTLEFGQKKKGVINSNNGIDATALAQLLNPPVADRDKDAVPDKEDGCPCVAGSVCAKGCPDADGDGIPDKEDECPDVKGLEKYHGCPYIDTDKDGIHDDKDQCPQVAGVEKYNGCPVPDTDGDGLKDDMDGCPKTPGPMENKGCPVIKQEVLKKLNYAAENILFETNTSTLKVSSFTGLNDVVKIMNENPGIHLYIDGHTDNVGGLEANQELSERRAAAVLEYLISKGADNLSIHSAGHGESMPIADNTKPDGRQQNRRVELTLKYN